jgi:hypothetical protein
MLHRNTLRVLSMLRLSGSAIRRKLFVGLWIAATALSMAGWLAAIAWVGYRAIELLVS